MTGWGDLISDGDVTSSRLEAAFCLDRELVTAVARARAALVAARQADNASGGVVLSAKAVQAELDAAEAAVEAAQTIIRVESIPDGEWRALMAQHPPTAEQRKAGHLAHTDKFPVAAVARCICEVDHRGRVMVGSPPLDWVRDLRDTKLTAGEWEHLCGIVNALNQGFADMGKLVGATGSRRPSEPSSTTAAPGESPTASS